MRVLLLLAAFVLPLFSSSQQIAKGLTASNGKFIGFYEYKPADYSTNTTVKYPLIIFLHGIVERGNGTTDLPKVKTQGIPKNIDFGHKMTFTWDGKTETFLVLSPQCSTADSLWHPFYIDEMLKYAKQNLRIDTNRIFLTGLSMGGGGTWAYASASVKYAQQFAGIVPVCGPCLMKSGSNIANSKTSVYAFHALDDREFWAPPSCTINALDSINKYKPVNKPVATLYSTGGHAIWPKAYDTTYLYQNPSLYEWLLSQNKSLPLNKYPLPNAGKDTLIHSASAKATLNGTASVDTDGTIVRYIWRRVFGPSGSSLSNATQPIASITKLKTAGTYKFELKVIDNRANWAMDTMTIIVNASPIARAGADVVISLPLNTVTVNGSSSSDADGTLTNYSWTKVSGPSTYTIVSPTTASTAINNLVRGSYKFRLTVTDNKGGTAYDEVAILVNAPPIARAGADSIINLPRTSTILRGTGSSDIDGTISSYTWTKISGPSTFILETPGAATTNLTNLVQGVYLFRLAVIDNRGAPGADTVMITLNIPPVAKAGSDSTISLPRNYTTLRGNNSSDADGSISEYAWSKIAGPLSSTIQSPAAATTSVTNLGQGVYSFKLTVKDNRGAVASDTVNVTINAATSQSSQNMMAFESIPSAEGFNIFPHLATNAIHVRVQSRTKGRAILTIFDMSGKKVKQVEFNKQNEDLQQNVFVHDLKPGPYNIEITIGHSKRFVTKFVKQ